MFAFIASSDNRPIGYVCAFSHDWVVYRDLDAVERVRKVSRFEYPRMERLDPEVSLQMVSAVLKIFEESNASHVVCLVPLDCRPAQDILFKCGMQIIGTTTGESQQVVMSKVLGSESVRLDLFPVAGAEGSKFRSSATAVDAPNPEKAVWDSMHFYSGYSLLPHLDELLKGVMPKGARRMLSCPSATGDALLSVPYALDRLLGVDVTDEFVRFGIFRADHRWLDALNQLVLGKCYTASLTGCHGTLKNLVERLCKLIGVSEDADLEDGTAQLLAAYRFGQQSSAVKDYWITLKGLCEWAMPNTGLHPLKLITEVDGTTGCRRGRRGAPRRLREPLQGQRARYD